MMTRRLSTPMPESPVRFYRIIAVSFLVITVSLLSVVLYMTTKRATVTVIAKEEKTSFSLNAPLRETADPSAVQGVIVLRPFSFTKKYAPVGTKTVEGTAHGELTIFNKTEQPLTLIPKTRFENPTGIVFRLPKYTTVPAGGQVVAEVVADVPGQAGDIGPSQFFLPALSPTVKDSIYAVSTQPMSGGARQIGVVGSDDLAAANADFSQKARDEFLASGAGANLPDNVKVIVGVVDVKTSPSHAVGQEASEFSLTGTTTLLVATYHVDDVRRLLEQEIRRRSDTDSLKVLGLATDIPSVSIASYDVAAKTAQLTISQEAMVTLDAASARLTPENFVGKTKSEIETYVNGFQYVAGTEVKFSPQFLMRTAPSLSDKIKVIVKNIK